MSDQSQGPGWWYASDGKRYPPQATAAPPIPPPPAPPSPSPMASAPPQSRGGPRYEAVVNKKSINVQILTNQLNQRWDHGWRLAHIYEQGGNTCMIFERRD